MTSKQILEAYLSYFENKGHKQVPNVSLVPENDPTLLYVNSGMFPLVPYLSGEPHPLGKRIMNVQRCLRFFEDLDKVGETNRHTTAFHMLGNWSLGDYFKREQLNWFYEFLLNALRLNIYKVYASVFEGDADAPKDEESIEVIKEIYRQRGIEAKENERIFAYSKEENWWQRGDAVGELGGPDSEVFYYIGGEGDGFGKNPREHQDEFIEIGNSVFMQYRKTETGWEELPQKNVDFGGGLERIAMVVQEKRDIYLTDGFYPIIQSLESTSQRGYFSEEGTTKSMRTIADHMRGAAFLAMDGVFPSNKDQGYILRRLLRRIVRSGKILGIERDISVNLVPVVVEMFSWLYPDLPEKQNGIREMFSKEEEKFRKTLDRGAREFKKDVEKIKSLAEAKDTGSLAEYAFDMYQSFGYPFEMFTEDLRELGFEFGQELVDVFSNLFTGHQEKSREGAGQKFEGGLADHSDQTLKYHTATHLLHLALREVLGDQVVQHGSNITGERLRFDFNHPEKLTDEQIQKIEEIINENVNKALPVNFEIMSKEKALETGAIHAFQDKYEDQVKVYYIGDTLENAVSKEFCGGPHVSNTSEIDPIRIYKQEKIGEGMLRVYAKSKS